MGYCSVVGSYRSHSHLLEVGTTTVSDVPPDEPQTLPCSQLWWQRGPIAAGDVLRRPEMTCEGE